MSMAEAGKEEDPEDRDPGQAFNSPLWHQLLEVVGTRGRDAL